MGARPLEPSTGRRPSRRADRSFLAPVQVDTLTGRDVHYITAHSSPNLAVAATANGPIRGKVSAAISRLSISFVLFKTFISLPSANEGAPTDWRGSSIMMISAELLLLCLKQNPPPLAQSSFIYRR